tara:strand:+ start:471 stop:740 length:270 start_codon:yes stop_codon:yes gene_type:complete
MSLAPYSQMGKLVGRFIEKSEGNDFEYDGQSDLPEWPHRVWVTTPHAGIDSGWRYAKVLKTVAYIITDEDADGIVLEKWNIKAHTLYGN